VRGGLTYSIKIDAKHPKQAPISLLAIVIATLIVVDPIREVTVDEVEAWAVVGFGPFTKVSVEDFLWLLRCETMSPFEVLTLRLGAAIPVVLGPVERRSNLLFLLYSRIEFDFLMHNPTIGYPLSTSLT